MLHFGLKHMDTVSCPGLTIRLPLHLPPVGAVIIAQPEGIVSAFGAHNHLATKAVMEWQNTLGAGKDVGLAK